MARDEDDYDELLGQEGKAEAEEEVEEDNAFYPDLGAILDDDPPASATEEVEEEPLAEDDDV